MKILINCLSSVSGGAVSYLQNMSPLLSRLFLDSSEGNELRFLAHESQRALLGSIPESQCCWMKGARLIGWQRVLWEHRHLARIASEEQADVVFTPYQTGSRMRRRKHVMMLRNMEPFLFDSYPYALSSLMRNLILQWETSRALRGADRIIAVGEVPEKQMTNGLGISPWRIRRIYHGRDTSFAPDGDWEEDQKCLQEIGVSSDFLLTCGSMLPYRRYEDVIESFNRCAGAVSPKLKLVIAGSGTDKRYRRLIQRTIVSSPYRDRILAVGHVPHRTMMALYRRCVLCVIASEIEACPNIVIEALSSGCVIVSCDRPPLPEIVQGASLEYPSRNISELTSRIRLGIEDTLLRRRMKALAIERAGEFSWAKCAKETYSALVEW